MKITDVTTVLLSAPMERRGVPPWTGSASLIKITTDDGLSGLGEAYAGFFAPEAVPPIVELYKPLLIGEDPLNVHGAWQKLHIASLRWGRTGFPVSIVSGIECALWDIMGKSMGMPVYQLLGGLAHRQMPVYASIGLSGSVWPLERTLENIQRVIDEGARAIKIATGYVGREQRLTTRFIKEEEEKVKAIRNLVGDDVELMVDRHAGSRVPSLSSQEVRRAIQLVKVMEPYSLLFFEEPVPPTDLDVYAEIRAAANVPIAGGEAATTLHEFKQYLKWDAIDVAQPDAPWIGGITQCLKAIAAAEAHDVGVALHGFGTAASIAPTLHVALASSNVFIMEYPWGWKTNPLLEELLVEPFDIEDGHIVPPKTSGLGLKLTDDVIEKYPFIPGTGQSARNVEVLLQDLN